MSKIIFLNIVLLATPFLLQAQVVDLLWEAQTYTPANYEGRALPSPGSTVRVVAITDVSNPGFYWRKDGLAIRSASGPGKNVLEYYANLRPGNQNEIEVVVRQTEGATGQPVGPVLAQTQIEIPVIEPEIIFYQANEGEAVDYRHYLPELKLNQERVRIIVEPYYFSLPDWLDRKLTFNWRLDGEKIEVASSDPRFLTIISNPDAGAGERTIELLVKNREQPMQIISQSLPILFGSNHFSF